MTPLTGAGEQRGAEVVDERGGTLPPGDGEERVSPSEQTTIQIPAQHAVGEGPGRPTAIQAVHTWTSGHGPIVRRVALGLAVCLVGAAGFAGLRKIADAPPDPNAPTNSAQTPAADKTTPDEAAEGVRRAAEGQAVLQRMADAIQDERKSSFLETIDPKATAFDGQARTIYSNLGKLPLAAFKLRYVSDDTGALAPDRQAELGGTESWLAQVEVSWQLTGFDAKPARETLPVTFVTRDGTTYAASFSERFVAGQRRPIWALGGIEVAKAEHSLVISLDSQADADDYSTVTDRAVESVTKVWGKNWKQKAVVYLPAKQSEMEFVLGAQPGTYSQIAAVTMAELDTPMAGAPLRVVANPKLFEELGKQGRRIVLTHETTHVASNATASPVPLWLAEGFADYVAFTAVSVQDESAAKELFKAVRAGKVPKTLPTAEAFAASSAELPLAYESGWLACRLIEEREGQAKLVKFYRAVHASKSPTGLADAFRTVLGTTEQEFTADWQRYLKRLAGV
ncbi:hypothetical protein [Kribbella sp. CA-293567]|uniref:hypothetical protein n=1 Tax=Kribbella sp. CA-293567 TaxID=3002436 RepID=UPI0022DE8E32|nr:hypothetical protein [Kribbella sp. CA-293567]WBQ02670.1 hypothetical protein OX958_22095 [Kribbella sp. CA-293567]